MRFNNRAKVPKKGFCLAPAGPGVPAAANWPAEVPFAPHIGRPCPHFNRDLHDRLLSSIVVYHRTAGYDSCECCSEEDVNYWCGGCGATRCGRRAHGHMAEHMARHPDHHIAWSKADGHIYCYSCSSYVLLLRPLQAPQPP
jgi:hypothetical protein